MSTTAEGAAVPAATANGQGASVSDRYSEAMKGKMGSTLTYRHEDGMNYARVTPKLIVGSCPQLPEDVDRLHGGEGVGVIFCLQEDKDMEHFGLDVAPIRRRAAELGIAHVREPVRDFDPFDLRRRLPVAVGRLARELASRPEGQAAYVHCTAGLGRAPGTALAYMFWMDGACLDEAYGRLFEVRRCHPQLGMVRAATCDLIAGGEGGLCHTEIRIARKGASVVEVAGLDVGWGKRLRLEKDANGGFVLSRQLPAGSYQYKFIVDGEWLANPDSPTVDNNGNVNNVATVVPPPGSADAERRERIMAPGGRPTAEELALIREALLAGPS